LQYNLRRATSPVLQEFASTRIELTHLNRSCQR
jgi:hypothetical protein